MKRSNNLKYNYGSRVDIYIVYELGASSSSNSDPTLKNCLFGAVTLTKNVDIEKYGYSGYGTRFDRRGSFSFLGSGFGQNVLIFGVDVSYSAHIDHKKKRHIISWNMANTRVRILTAEKNVFNQFYCYK